MYNPASHQWSIYGIDLDRGELSLPPLIGQFTGRRGEFFDSELRNGCMVQVRYVWSDLTPKSARMEQSFSPDGGKSWGVNWIVALTATLNPRFPRKENRPTIGRRESGISSNARRGNCFR
jgi:hypothetical protein